MSDDHAPSRTPTTHETRPARTLLLVLGMGRSGTSSLTRVLGLCGGALPRSPLPPVADNNERGFWEPAPIVRAHDRILDQLGTTWDGPMPPAAPVRDEWVDELARLVREQYGEAPLIALKDPRISRLVPLWRRVAEHLGVRLACVIALRHPDEVVMSLARREGYAREKCLRLWREYTLSAERFTRDLPRVVVPYEGLLSDWRAQIHRINTAVGIGLDPDADPASVDRFLDPRLRHHRATEDATPDRAANAVYREMTRLASDRGADVGVLDRAALELGAESAELRRHTLRRVAPASGMEFTGERFVPSVSGEIETEHVARYVFASALCAGKRVLDIACGEGYGAALLAQVASEVVGVDIDPASIDHANRNYARESLSFEVGSCEQIPAKKDSFDVVVSFETIEHIEDHARFLREVRRVLRPGGVFVCSTPDTTVYLAGQPKNPYHKKELTGAEFEALLSKKFEHTAFFGQRLVSGSVIARDENARTEIVRTADGRAYERAAARDGATYRIGVCTDGRPPRIPDQILSDTRFSIGMVSSLTQARARLETEVAAHTKRITELSARCEAAERAQAELEVERARAVGSRDQNAKDLARFAEDRGRLVAEREAAQAERDAAIRDLASAQVDYQRAAAELDRVRESLIEAREKAAAAQASLSATRSESETLRRVAKESLAAREVALHAQKQAEIHAARTEERSAAAQRRSEQSEHEAGLARLAVRQALAETEAHRERAATSARELDALRASRSWRWTAPFRLAAASGSVVGIKTLSLTSRVFARLRLPGAERLRVARTAALIRHSPLFDAAEYLRRNPDVAAAGIDPARHFAARGKPERRACSDLFDTAWYLDTNPDVAAAAIHPLEHYITQGIREGRRPRPEPTALPTRIGAGTPQTSTYAAAASPTPPPTTAAIEVRTPTAEPVPMVGVDPDQLARTKVLAFYLPQFHPIPENDAWWGKGFTEWANVTRARPMFPGHAQPILPGELGFYDLRLPEVRERQAELARAAGIHGFCYHHYWFNGRRVLERPLEEVLRLGEPDFPFCVSWANENWTRRWDGLEQEILLQQKHTLASDRRFILDLLPYLEDERYVRVDGRPVILVYRADMMADAADTAAVWRDECARAGLGEIHLCAVQFRTGDPRPLGFDAAVEFPPHHFPAPEITTRIEGLDPAFGGSVFDYAAGVRELIARPRKADYRLYRGVMPSWDNTARRMHQAIVHHGATPDLYEAWLRSAVNIRQPDDGIRDNLVFINAWNEWAEGTVLEPRRDLGDAYLRATARTLGVDVSRASPEPAEPRTGVSPPVNLSSAADERPAPAMSPRVSLEEYIKRVVRTNTTLNSFVSRHPVLKSRAALVARRFSAGANQAPGSGLLARAPARGRPPGRVWQPGPDETAGDDARSLLIVSHDACLAGAQVVVLELLRNFVNDPSIRVHHLICGSGTLEPQMRRLATTCCLDDLALRGTSRATNIAQALDALPPVDLALCNTAATADVLRACAVRSIPTISYIHELPTTIDTMLGGEKTVRAIERHAGRIVVVSRFVRDRLAERYDIPPERFDVVHMGTFPSKAGSIDRIAAARTLRAEIGADPETPVVLGCGAIHHRKGTDLWVAAAARCIRATREADRPEPIFVWVGWDQDGKDFRLWCEHHARSAGIANRVRFIGAREDTSPYFAGADVFALSSREDPFPLVSLEAMVCGTPVVAFEDAGGAPEALRISGSEAGLIVPFGDASAMGDAIARLLGDPALSARLSQGGQEVTRGRLRWGPYVRALIDGRASDVLPNFETPNGNPHSRERRPISGPQPAEPNRPRLLVVSHDACLAGSQLILLENLRHWTREGFDCRAVLLRGGAIIGKFEDLCPTTRLDRTKNAAGPDSGDRLAALLDDWETAGWTPDAAFCNTVASSPVMRALKNRAVPIVSSLYELPTSIDATLGGAAIVARITETSERIIVASAFVRDRLAESYGLNAARLEPIHTGVLARRLPDRDQARTAIRRELGVPAETFVVLGCGSVHHRKGTDLFVHAAAEARRARSDRPLVFVWVGEDQSGPTFRNWCLHDAQRLGVADIVRFVGGRDDPAPWFAGADAFALTSREDPFPMVCLEALAAGLGVVAFNGAGGAPEALLDPEREGGSGDRGIVVPYMDTTAMGGAIAELARDPDRLADLRARSLTFAEERLGWDRYMDDINAVLASCSPGFRRPVPVPAEAPA